MGQTPRKIYRRRYHTSDVLTLSNKETARGKRKSEIYSMEYTILWTSMEVLEKREKIQPQTINLLIFKLQLPTGPGRLFRATALTGAEIAVRGVQILNFY